MTQIVEKMDKLKKEFEDAFTEFVFGWNMKLSKSIGKQFKKIKYEGEGVGDSNFPFMTISTQLMDGIKWKNKK